MDIQEKHNAVINILRRPKDWQKTPDMRRGTARRRSRRFTLETPIGTIDAFYESRADWTISNNAPGFCQVDVRAHSRQQRFAELSQRDDIEPRERLSFALDICLTEMAQSLQAEIDLRAQVGEAAYERITALEDRLASLETEVSSIQDWRSS